MLGAQWCIIEFQHIVCCWKANQICNCSLWLNKSLEFPSGLAVYCGNSLFGLNFGAENCRILSDTPMNINKKHTVGNPIKFTTSHCRNKNPGFHNGLAGNYEQPHYVLLQIRLVALAITRPMPEHGRLFSSLICYFLRRISHIVKDDRLRYLACNWRQTDTLVIARLRLVSAFENWCWRKLQVVQ